MKRLGLISLLGLSLLVAPAAAHAAGWGHGGGGSVGWHGGGGHVGWHGGGGHVGAPAPHVHYAAPAWGGGYGYRGGYVHPHVGFGVGVYAAPRVWVGGAWSYPPYAGWVWVRPHWAWNGYQWVWQDGYWAPPAY